MMRQMRENTKWIMLLTAMAFVALMVTEWGMDLSGRSSAGVTGGELGRVNGEPITYEEYISVYRNLYEQQSTSSPDPITPAMNRQIEDAAWEQLVSQKLLDQEMRRRGITVTAQEVRDAARLAPPEELMTAPAFQTDGQFDLVKYQQFLASPTLDEQFLRQLEAYYRERLPRSKLYFQNVAGVWVTDEQLWRMWRDEHETATVRYIAYVPNALVPDAQVTVSDASIRAYYDEHRDDFVRPAQATVRYVVLNRAATAADSAAARTLAAAHRAAITGGESFEAVARRASGVDSLTRLAGERFTVARGQSAPALEQAAFAQAVGGVTQPVETQLGYHIVKLEARRGDTLEVRQIVVPIALSPEREEQLQDRADQLEDEASERGLQQAAAALGLSVRTGELTPALPILPAVGAIDDGVDWAFRDAVVGDVSDVFESPQAFYVLELVSRRDEGTLPLEEATPTVRAVLMRRARMDQARQMLADAERRARAGQSLESIAAATGARVADAGPFTRGQFVPGLGRLNAAIGAAFGLNAGQTSPLIEAEAQLFLIQTVSRAQPNRAEWQLQIPQQRARVLQSLGEARWQQYVTALRESAEIIDNRQQVLRQAPGQNPASR
ncbi:MAG TPA: SurA N-terminal domain-containing protein [Longimicrobiales bacterium]|nr:SurA N-terminal domain-containing protein [Longimicrobiales bacterium]